MLTRGKMCNIQLSKNLVLNPKDGYRGGTYEGMSVLFIDLEENKKVLEELLY